MKKCRRCGAVTHGDYCGGCAGAAPLVCEHGGIKRQCPICERDEEIAALRARVAEMEAQVAADQRRVDGIIYYRNLALSLGATTAMMLTDHDRALVGKVCLEEVGDWAECEAEELAEARARAERAEAERDELVKDVEHAQWQEDRYRRERDAARAEVASAAIAAARKEEAS